MTILFVIHLLNTERSRDINEQNRRNITNRFCHPQEAAKWKYEICHVRNLHFCWLSQTKLHGVLKAPGRFIKL